jgi:hypothetical protein
MTTLQKKEILSHLPVLGLLADEFTHQILALLALNIHNLNTTLLQIRFAAEERLVLAEHNTVDLIQNASTGAHVAGRERGVHRCSLVRGGWKAACVLESGDLGLLLCCQINSYSTVLSRCIESEIRKTRSFSILILLFFRTYMNSRAVLLHAHVVAAAQDFAFGRDEACADGDAAFVCAFLGLFKSGDETCVGCGHCE